MRQFRRSTPTFSSLTALRALAGVLVAAAVLSAPVPITAAQPSAPVEPNRSRAAAPAQAAQAAAPAQPAQAAPAPQIIYGNERRNAEETRERLRDIINQYSPTLSQVFRHDPSLMSNVDYVGNYPALASFLQQHPEIAHNPSYFVGEPDWHRDRDPRSESIGMWRDIMAGVMIFSGLLLAATLVTWLIKTLIDYRRWLRLTRIQTDAHTKLLDRLTSNDDLMAYIQSPSGRRFLESAPIALDSGGAKAVSAPVNRIMLSLQAGVILASGGCGFLYASGRVIPEVGPALFTIGVLAIAFGSGFVASAILAYGLSERLGLLAPSSRPSAE